MKSERGSALLVVMTFLMIMGILFMANATTIARLRGYLRSVERQQVERIAPAHSEGR